MALTNVAPTVFDQRSIFETLAASGLSEFGVSAVSRGLRSILNPEGLPQFFADPIIRSGFSADTPALFFHPNRLSIDNILLLSELNFGYEAGGYGKPDKASTQTLESLQENATIDSLPFIRNLAKTALMSAFSNLEAATAVTTQVLNSLAEQNNTTVRGSDFSKAPSETQAFGTTYSAVATDASLNGQFYSRFGLEQTGSISLDKLISFASTGPSTHYAVSLTRSQGDTPSGHLLDGGGFEVANELVLTAAQLSDFSYSAPENVGWDYINIIELEDSDSNGSYEKRGNYNTISLVTGEATQDAYYSNPYDASGTPEQTASYQFYAEAGIAVKRLNLVFSGVNSNGYTDAADALNNNQFRATVTETFEDGSTNQAVVDLYESNTNTINANFAYNAAQKGLQSTGISVKLHVYDTNFDISNVELYARFA